MSARKSNTGKVGSRNTYEFRETLAPTADEYSSASFTAVADVIQIITTILNSLLLIRFFVNLFVSDRSIAFINVLHGLTDWLTRPFATLTGTTPLSGTGYIDWPALIAFAAVSLVSWLGIRLTKAPHV
jgi:hypothetical protein